MKNYMKKKIKTFLLTLNITQLKKIIINLAINKNYGNRKITCLNKKEKGIRNTFLAYYFHLLVINFAEREKSCLFS